MILEAVTGKIFAMNDSVRSGISVFPELASIVVSDYVQPRGLGVRPSCPALYRRRDSEQEAAPKRFNFKAIVASATKDVDHPADNLDDWSVTEDSCTDAWLLPDRAMGYLDLAFVAEAAVQEIHILNIRGDEQMDRGADVLRVKFLRAGREVFRRSPVSIAILDGLSSPCTNQ